VGCCDILAPLVRGLPGVNGARDLGAVGADEASPGAPADRCTLAQEATGRAKVTKSTRMGAPSRLA
jgi:hypothetical protein